MDDRRRTLLAIRTIEVSYRSALMHAPSHGPGAHEWLGNARQRAERLLNELESRLLSSGPVDAKVALQLRIARDTVARADHGARGASAAGDRPANRAG